MIDIEFKFPDWAKKIKSHIGEINLLVAATVQTNRGMLFDQEGALNGRSRWKPLVFRKGQILSDTGTLRKSIAPYNPKGRPGKDGIVRFAGDQVTVGTKVLYARLMNDGTAKMPGGVLRAKDGKALMIPLPQGAKANDDAKAMKKEKGTYSLLSVDPKTGRTKKQNVIFRKSVRIPARPFDDWNQEDQNQLDATIQNKIARILNG